MRKRINMRRNPLRIGIIGTGSRGVNSFGRMIAERSDAVISGLADINPVRLERAAKILSDDTIPTYSDAESLFRAEPLDGVIITTPDFTHAEYAIAAMKAGIRNLLIEKPVATTVPDCLRIIQAAKAVNAVISIGFNLRHVPALARIKDLISAGEIGRLMFIENREFYSGGRTYMSRWNRFYSRSGGLWIHKGSHDFDIFNWWNSGGEPHKVSAFAGLNALRPDAIPFPVEEGEPVGPTCSSCSYYQICPDRITLTPGSLQDEETAKADGYQPDTCLYISEKDTHDNGIAMVEYDNNVRASHLECFVCGFSDRLYTIAGDRGTIQANLNNPNSIDLRPRWGESRVIDVPMNEEGGHGGSDPALLEQFLKSIRGETAPSSSLEDGLRAVAVGQAAEISWRTGRTVSIKELMEGKGE